MKGISIIIPTFNEEQRIEKCLKSIASQNYPASKVEILVVDDGSTDATCEIARRFKAKILTNGTHNIERGKSIGFENAKYDYILFLDADNTLLTQNWLKEADHILTSNKRIIGVQSYRYKYFKSDPLVNRYCSLFGINDPMAFYLGKRGQLMQSETTWIYPKTLIKDRKTFFHCRFNTDNLPTVGSQGYMTRRRLLRKTNWKPYLFHMDSVYELVSYGHNEIAFIKQDIQHDYAVSVSGLLRKLRRNIQLFHKQKSDRKYVYTLTPLKLGVTVVIMLTGVVPLYHSIRGFIRLRDYAWFLHPVLSVAVVLLYSYETIAHRLSK